MIEIFKEFFDLVAFIFITPEIISRSRIQTHINRIKRQHEERSQQLLSFEFLRTYTQMVFGEGEMKAVRYVWLGLYSVLGIFFVLRFDLIKGLYDPWSWLLLGVIIIFIYPITFGIIFALSGRNIAISSTSNLKKAAIIVWLALGFTSLIFVVVKYFHESYWLSLGAMIFIAGALIGLIAIWILAELVASLILNTRIRTLLFLIAFVTFFAARVLGVTKAITELLEGSPAG